MSRHLRIGKSKKRMRCADEELRRRTFVYVGGGDWECGSCGFAQLSTANGCAQLVGSPSVTWHDHDVFHRYRRIAVRGGYNNLPETPKA